MKTFSVFCGTWNVNDRVLNPPADNSGLNSWLFPDIGRPPVDLYAVGFEEIIDLNARNVVLGSSESAGRAAYWQGKVKSSLDSTGQSFTIISEVHLVGMLLVIFINDSFLPHVSDIRTSVVGTGLMGVGNKGGVSTRFCIHGHSFCFVCSHLRPHEDAAAGRNADVKTIADKIVFYPTMSEAVASSAFGDSAVDQWAFLDVPSTLHVMDHDYVFWFGDLNYGFVKPIADMQQCLSSYFVGAFDFSSLTSFIFRIDTTYTTEAIFNMVLMGEWESLVSSDQLTIEKGKGNVFVDFHEGILAFPPTYKFTPGTDDYDQRPGHKIRAPAWCDRVLWWFRDGTPDRVRLRHCSSAELQMSDHKPVSAAFDVDLLVPIPEKQREVYTELIDIVDKYENSSMPRIKVSPNFVEFGCPPQEVKIRILAY